MAPTVRTWLATNRVGTVTLRHGPSAQRLLALVLILAIHLLLLVYLQNARQRNVVSSASSAMTMVLLAARPVPVAVPVAAVALKKAERPRQSDTPVALVRRDRPDRSDPPAPTPETIGAPAASIDVAPASDLVGASLRAVGDIDKAMRSQLRRLPYGDTASVHSSLGNAIAAAGINHNLAPTLRQRTLPDGSTIVQVSSAAGTYCVTQQSAGATDGRDHLQNGNPALPTSCGHLFD